MSVADSGSNLNKRISLEWASRSGMGFVVLDGMSQDDLRGLNR
jgi:hypothetical protein